MNHVQVIIFILGATQRNDAPARFRFDHWRAWIYWLELGEENSTGGRLFLCVGCWAVFCRSQKRIILLDQQQQHDDQGRKQGQIFEERFPQTWRRFAH